MCVRLPVRNDPQDYGQRHVHVSVTLLPKLVEHSMLFAAGALRSWRAREPKCARENKQSMKDTSQAPLAFTVEKLRA